MLIKTKNIFRTNSCFRPYGFLFLRPSVPARSFVQAGPERRNENAEIAKRARIFVPPYPP